MAYTSYTYAISDTEYNNMIQRLSDNKLEIIDKESIELHYHNFISKDSYLKISYLCDRISTMAFEDFIVTNKEIFINDNTIKTI